MGISQRARNSLDEFKARSKKNRVLNFLLWSSYSLAVVATILVGALAGVILGYQFNLSRVEELETHRPDVISYVYADDGRSIGDFATERRIMISYNQIPKHFKDAVIATEDSSFYKHTGIDFVGIARAAIKNLLTDNLEGASTLTQQLSKLRFTSPEQSYERKIKDAIFALQIEKKYSKEQILTFYSNQIYLGHGNYGVAAAADYFFGKPLEKLTLSECALLAGIIRSPLNYSPINHLDAAKRRRDFVLSRMRDEDYLSEEERKKASAEPIVVSRREPENAAPYPVETVRQYLEERYKTSEIWTQGLQIHTTINYEMQQAAQAALQKGLLEFDKRKGWRGPVTTVEKEGATLDNYYHADWNRPIAADRLRHGLVLSSTAREARVKIGNYQGRLLPEGIKWTRRKQPLAILKPGDVALFRVQKVMGNQVDVTLEQLPVVQGAVLVLENRTGQIKAMVGGFDFQYSKFNRALQAMRQVGSTFKPVVYAAALERGASIDSTVDDAPISFRDSLGRVWAPANYDNAYKGVITYRQALAHSRNVPAVRIAQSVGIKRVIEMARRLGITSPLPPYLPIAIGAAEVSVLEMTSAISAFPNGGVQARPYFIKSIEDYNGITQEENTTRIRDALSEEVANQMLTLLRGTVEFGTATRAKMLKRPLGGKTGTTNDSTDSWFTGFTPTLTATVWVGYDTKRSLGPTVTGSSLALPVWIDFMREALKDKPVEEFPTFTLPNRMVAQAPKESSAPPEPAAPIAPAPSPLPPPQD